MSSAAVAVELNSLLFAGCSGDLSASVSPLLAWQKSASEEWLTSRPATPQKAAAVLRIWGDWPAAALTQLVALLPEGGTASRFEPHPDLAAALEIRLSQPLDEAGVEALRTLAQQPGCELNYLTQPVLLTEPGLLVMDMDSTAIEIECIDEIAKLAGTGDEVAAVTAAAMRGELDFAQSLRQRVATLKGAPETILAEVLRQLPLMPGLAALVAELGQRGWSVAIASGGFTYFTEALKQQLGLSATYANQLEIIGGRLTGLVLGEIVDAAAKAAVVRELAQERHIAPTQTVAIGDGANDLPMLAQAALGVAFHAKPLVQAKARYAIRQGSLLQLLYLLDKEDWRA